MKVIAAAVVAGGLTLVFAGSGSPAEARSSYSRKYAPPSTITQEQRRRNAESYERGGYYEHDSNALPWGSNAWREQKRREIGG